MIRDAIQRELSRQGQIYFLHNRVQTIQRIALRIKELCPGARVEIGHGQMDEDDLEEVMQRFVDGKIDVLVSTTIIESGLDIPNANTIIIDRADRFGLADLYQLRGRVGRAQMKAYAYLMLPREMMTEGAARKRINAIKQYSTLGAGFKIAMRDLEIRGAGNVLGTAQSGHIVAIGFDLYCQLLKQAVTKLKGEKAKPRVEVPVRLDFLITNEAEYVKAGGGEVAGAFLPAAYISEPKMRIQAYRALAGSDFAGAPGEGPQNLARPIRPIARNGGEPPGLLRDQAGRRSAKDREGGSKGSEADADSRWRLHPRLRKVSTIAGGGAGGEIEGNTGAGEGLLIYDFGLRIAEGRRIADDIFHQVLGILVLISSGIRNTRASLDIMISE